MSWSEGVNSFQGFQVLEREGFRMQWPVRDEYNVFPVRTHLDGSRGVGNAPHSVTVE